MTPDHASPEQIRGEPVTTASDVYVLGVLLYELLCGQRPFQVTGLRFHEIERVICEKEPPPPSDAGKANRITSTELERIAAQRVSTPQRLRRELSGDLDNIVMMAMRKEADRRYGSVEQFSADLDLHLRGMVAPLSDRLGRRPVIFAGLSLFIVGSIAGMLANSIALLIAARIVQAFGSGAAMAVARATLMDAFGPERAASGIAYTATAILVVPMLAPTIGGFAVELAGWRLVFGLCVVLGTAAMLFTALRVQETHHASVATRRGPDTLESYRQLLLTGRYRAYALFGSLLFAAVYVFIAGAPHVAMDVLHISPSQYGLLFMLPASASFAGFFTAARISRRVGALRMNRAR